ncbi:MAG: hypothetical protein MUO40_06550 [Anaerolineaceae bacterium]|nr:hypothetical protein [Anaerolineaceae bacterium]
MTIEKLIIRSGQQICRSFQLPLRGQVLVRTGQRVEMDAVLAECCLPEKFVEFDVSSGFRVSVAKADAHIERLVGEKVEAGDIVARMGGIFQRIYRAPGDGSVVSIKNGRVLLALGEQKHVCKAGFPGLIVELIPDRGAVVCAQGSVLQGVWGNGKNTCGDLAYLGGSENSPFDQEAITDKLQGKIVVAGSCLNQALLNKLLNCGASGLVVSSFAPILEEKVTCINIPFMSLAGFGDIAIDEYSEGMILSMMGRQVFLNAHSPDPKSGMKPELIMLGEEIAVDGLFQDEFAFHIGAKVRLTGKPYTGSVGEIIDLPAIKERYASGLRLSAAVVKRSDGQIIRVPLTNIEIII